VRRTVRRRAFAATGEIECGESPSPVRCGVRVEDVLSRLRAGDRMADVAEDFGLEDEELSSLLLQAA